MNTLTPLYLIQDKCLESISCSMKELSSLFDRHPPDTHGVYSTLIDLVKYMSKRNECISFLISHNYIWDGEIVARSFYECCAKIWLISFSAPEEKLKLVEEFWGGVRDIGDRKRAAKAKIAGELFGDETDSKKILSFLESEPQQCIEIAE